MKITVSNHQNYVVAIAYRDDGGGKGAFFDHFTLRNLTGWATEITHPEGISTVDFANWVNYRNGEQLYGLPMNTNLPALSADEAVNSAFLFIPGYTRDADDKQLPIHQARIAYEKKLISKAMTRGQPVLAVCAGSWTLWQAYGGEVIPVTDHNYGGAMPRLSKSKPEVCNNKMIHRVDLSPHSFISGAMGFKEVITEKPLVNSVHWNAVDNTAHKLPLTLEVTAIAVKDDEIAPFSRQQKKMQPQESVEVFETKFGVPMLGIQWHPEAFNPGENLRQESIFKFMKEAGQTYLNRKALNTEFQKVWSSPTSHTTFFANPKTNSDTISSFDLQVLI